MRGILWLRQCDLQCSSAETAEASQAQSLQLLQVPQTAKYCWRPCLPRVPESSHQLRLQALQAAAERLETRPGAGRGSAALWPRRHRLPQRQSSARASQASA
jgi:hypothetical protein